MISFINAQGSVKIRLACSKVLLLIISSSNIVTRSNGKYYPETKLYTKYSKDKKIIFIPPSNIKHFIKRSSVTYYILEGQKMGNIMMFSISFLFIFFFHKMATLM